MHIRILLLLSVFVAVTLSSCHDDKNLVLDEDLGIGTILYSQVDNTKPYNWYFDQANTGEYSLANCGPTCATMLIKWKNKDWDRTVEDFRSSPSEDGAWWRTDDMRDTLRKYGADCTKKIFNTEKLPSLKADLKYGNLVLFCLDSYHLDENLTDQGHDGRYYAVPEPKAGHFIIVKGYKETDTGLWLEVYDPMGLNKTYADGTPKGINRYHHIDDITEAVTTYWSYYIKVDK